MKRGIKSDKRGPRWWPQRVTVAANCDEEMNGKDAGDSDEELMVAAERDFNTQHSHLRTTSKTP
jgi:hypothetical protein